MGTCASKRIHDEVLLVAPLERNVLHNLVQYFFYVYPEHYAAHPKVYFKFAHVETLELKAEQFSQTWKQTFVRVRMVVRTRTGIRKVLNDSVIIDGKHDNKFVPQFDSSWESNYGFWPFKQGCITNMFEHHFETWFGEFDQACINAILDFLLLPNDLSVSYEEFHEPEGLVPHWDQSYVFSYENNDENFEPERLTFDEIWESAKKKQPRMKAMRR